MMNEIKFFCCCCSQELIEGEDFCYISPSMMLCSNCFKLAMEEDEDD